MSLNLLSSLPEGSAGDYRAHMALNSDLANKLIAATSSSTARKLSSGNAKTFSLTKTLSLNSSVKNNTINLSAANKVMNSTSIVSLGDKSLPANGNLAFELSFKVPDELSQLGLLAPFGRD